MKKLFLPLAVCLLMPGCSVKEDRGQCPCLLSFITAEAFAPVADYPDTEWKLTVTGYAEEGMIVEESFGLESVRDTLEYPVRRGTVFVTARLSDAEPQISDGYWQIPEGAQADRLYACCSRIDAGGETAFFRVLPHKQYATVTLLDNSGTEVPFGGRTLTVRGHSCGLDLTTLRPIEGPFACPAQASDALPERGVQVRIPRQEDASLELELADRDTVLRIPLGEVLFSQPYTPADEDVPDYLVWLSATGSAAWVSSVITVRPWK